MKMIYLDYAATAPVDKEVLQAMLPWFSEKFGNPSSTHSLGQEAKSAVEAARAQVASALEADTSEIIFTSSGTESSNLAIKGTALAHGQNFGHIITTAIEHPSVLESVYLLKRQGYDISVLPVNSDGIVDPDDVKKAITGKTILISVMHANNEIGTIQPVAEIGRIAGEYNILFHVDAVQTFGQIPFAVKDISADFISISGHKVYGPKGTGALYARKKAASSLLPLLHGGGQESGLRSSTHNVPGIVGLGKASSIARDKMKTEPEKISKLRDKLIKNILNDIEAASLNGHPEKRLPGNANISFNGIKSDVLLLSLDMKGVICSSGAACKSAVVEPSHVLKALGLAAEIADSSIRISIGRDTTEADIDFAMEAIKSSLKKLRVLKR
ncbi:MAG: cysteine desulfurase [Spirochaetes bacterium]|nr:cysteine desulfurase [Spirochaetota bacterium]